ncbi:small GTP-binding protein [Tritrichomonas foetus]|uniref:Small GTP-binding protein n=1 Tax=Tritrichomonas foetus TaxID=1144522 RepID=A0A1J4JTZ2_9EUKA|nr:small GTP-binding protein [Tritrichomonas foetus]|eukprot:OHT01936.1 small GTP-binding protein [Tritrichomonas foetus]
MNDDSSSRSLKVILVGSSGVGKTSLVSAFFENPFENQDLPTVAPASCSATVTLDDGTKVCLQIWDTAGQERFQSISQMFYRDSHVAFVCYDNEREESVEQWVERVRQQVPNCNILLVTTKSDLLSEEEQTACAERGADLMRTLNCKLHLLTSSATGLGVKELFQHAAQFYTVLTPATTETVKINEPAKRDKKKCC